MPKRAPCPLRPAAAALSPPREQAALRCLRQISGIKAGDKKHLSLRSKLRLKMLDMRLRLEIWRRGSDSSSLYLYRAMPADMPRLTAGEARRLLALLAKQAKA